MKRHAKIICTLGPASAQEAMIAKMASRGMDVARINFSHGDHRLHQTLIDRVRRVNEKHHYRVTILQDLEGHRLRVGRLQKNIPLDKDKIVYMCRESGDSSKDISFDYAGDLKEIKKGASVFIDDGTIHLKVLGHTAKRLKLKVIQGGVLKERKGINIPTLKLKTKAMTLKDQHDLEFGIQNRVEKIAQSFVRHKRDILRVADMVKSRLPSCKIIAKIENQEGVRNLDSIMEACDGIMVARGDLGVTMPIYKIPIIQKYIIRRCNRRKKFVIIATQMLDSMIEHGRPTRAEVSDVANAILDGTDYVMLSAETAVGRYPSRSIQMMRQIIEYTEGYEDIRF